MSDERPDNDGAPRFGRRPRQGSAPTPKSGDHPPQAPKPKVRIGPRRPDAPPPAAAAPRDPLKPQGGVRKPANRDGNNGRNGDQGGQPQGGQRRGNGQGQQARRKKKRNKDKFRHHRPEGGFAPPEPREPKAQEGLQGDLFDAEGAPREPDSSAGDSSAGQSGGSQGLGRNARRRKRRRERRDEARMIPEADVFEPAGALDMPSSDSVDVSFEEDESDLNLVEAPPPGSARPAATESVDDDDDGEEGDDGDDDEAPVTEQAPEGAQAAPAAGQRESRSKRRRKKRRDRMEAAVVDRSSGFWWADQWTRSFEAIYGSGASRARLQKGRSYSRRGQVTELEVGPNGVIARVQGSRPKPYQVRVELNRLRRETWGRILHQLAGKAAFLAQLLEGTLPPEIEDVFFDAGARLFPHGDNDVRSRCTCPDPVVPCKHVAAVHYALAEALQRDPFLLFALRGKSRDQFLQDLRDMRGRDGTRREGSAPVVEDLSQFWRMGRLAESVLRPTGWGSGGDPARLVQSLGEPQLEGIREGLFLPMLESTYRQVSEGMRRLPKDG